MTTLKQRVNRFFNTRVAGGEPDWALMIATGLVVVFGILMLASASGTYAYFKYQDGYYFIKHQLIALAIGLALFWFFSSVDYHSWKKYGFHLLLFSVLLLCLVFIPGLGRVVNGSRSWINIFGFSLQPSEFVKLSFLIYLAAWLESRGKKLEDFYQGTGPFVVVLAAIAALMLLQPDFGTLFVIALTSLLVYFVGGGKLKHIVVIVLLGAVAMFLMVKYTPHQAARFKCFFDPASNTRDACYQINQSLIAIGSGGFWGRGFGASRQKMLYLPEVSGDSIFAIVSEELGFIFSGGLIVLFIFLFFRGFLISRRAPDIFGRLLSIGVVSWISFQALINIGGMINLMPMTGVPLPFVSYGGSAIMSALAAIGLLVNISKQTKIT